MPLDKKQQIRGVRILLTVFYGFLLSSILFRYIIHGIVETIRQPKNPYAISMIVLGVIILVVIVLATHATWFDKAIILLVSGIVLIVVFILTLVFGIVRIVNAAPQRTVYIKPDPSVVQMADQSSDTDNVSSVDLVKSTSNKYAIAEDVTKLSIELTFILFAILGTFILFRYVKAKYAAVPTTEPKTKTTTP